MVGQKRRSYFSYIPRGDIFIGTRAEEISQLIYILNPVQVNFQLTFRTLS